MLDSWNHWNWNGEVKFYCNGWIIRGYPSGALFVTKRDISEKTAPNGLEVGGMEDNLEVHYSDLYMDEEEDVGLDAVTVDCEAGVDVDSTGSLIGKIRSFCPNIYFKLSAWERDFVENSVIVENSDS
jgi:hypothetical protein